MCWFLLVLDCKQLRDRPIAKFWKYVFRMQSDKLSIIVVCRVGGRFGDYIYYYPRTRSHNLANSDIKQNRQVQDRQTRCTGR